MTLFEIVIIILLISIFCSDLFLIFGWIVRINSSSHPRKTVTNIPVSILVPARNEEKHIATCLDSLLKLSYPISYLQILVGDDHSSDRTAEIVSSYATRYRHIELITIDDSSRIQGKSRVLSQLEKKANGKYLFFTDADTRVPSEWINEFVSEFESDPQTGLVSGITKVQSNGLFSSLQNTEWLMAFAMLHVLDHFGVSVTGIGNNMAVSRVAYDETGGYEKFPFSIVEDYQLSQEIIKKGRRLKHRIKAETKAVTTPMVNFSQLLKQRKRWMTGVWQIHWAPKLILIIRSLAVPALIGLWYHRPVMAILALVLKVLLDVTFFALITYRIKEKLNLVIFGLFQGYTFVTTYLSILYFVFPGKVDWKGRKY